MTRNEYKAAMKRLLGWMMEVHEAFVADKAPDERGKKPTLCAAVFPADGSFNAYAEAFCFVTEDDKVKIKVGDARLCDETAVSGQEV